VLVGVQVAISLVLVTGAGLAARSLARAGAADPGFESGSLAILATDLQQGRRRRAGTWSRRANALLAPVSALPGVSSAALTTRCRRPGGQLPRRWSKATSRKRGTGALELAFAYVSRDYFEALGLPRRGGPGRSLPTTASAPSAS
jgi:hypothetical protein